MREPAWEPTDLKHKHKGGLSELRAVCELWNLGYEVFRNQSASGIVDLVALKEETGEVRLFDVKSARQFRRKDGSAVVQCVRLSPAQQKLGVELIMVTPKGSVLIGYKGGEEFAETL